MKYTYIFLVILFLSPFQSIFAEELNAGFVQGLWYSEEIFFANEPVRIYAALRNNTADDLTATAVFKDNDKIIATKEISALSGRLIETWADWIPDYGAHTLSVTLTKVQIHSIGKETKDIKVTNPIAADNIIIDFDTDGDKIGNDRDTDDDGDGVEDTQELKNGTDPLVFNEPIEETAEKENVPLPDNDQTTSISLANISSEIQGLEQFIGDGVINNALSKITDTVHKSKSSLDSYTQKRDQKEITLDEIDAKLTSTINSTLENPEEAFATITRTQADPMKQSLFTHVGNFFKALFNIAYTTVLAVISFFLSYPSLVQITLLALALFLLYKLSKKFGKRPID